MKKTGKITFVERNKTQPSYKENNRWDVTFATGKSYTFLAKGDFKHDVGEDITFYITNEDKALASLYDPSGDYKPKTQVFNKKVTLDKTQMYIIKQSMIAASANFYSRRLEADDEKVLETARKFINEVINQDNG
jgi:hypothetical protein